MGVYLKQIEKKDITTNCQGRPNQGVNDFVRNYSKTFEKHRKRVKICRTFVHKFSKLENVLKPPILTQLAVQGSQIKSNFCNKSPL